MGRQLPRNNSDSGMEAFNKQVIPKPSEIERILCKFETSVSHSTFVFQTEVLPGVLGLSVMKIM